MISRSVSQTKLLIDTNVILDVVLARRPWAEDAALLFDVVARERARGYVASHAVTTVHYIVERERDRSTAATAVSDLLAVLDVVPLESADFQRALALRLRDYEDAVQVAAALRIGADYLVTRNEKDFKGAPVTSRSAGEILALLAPRSTE
ncbi:MAG: PIN domain-containing protein [Gemmatimonadaceae bacterium]|nr:PIN domain-containing protein [Gemmatimonadaceae bacterium]